MSDHQPAPEGKDPILWEVAKKRASFKGHLASYVIVNGFLWALWYFTSGRHHLDFDGGDFLPWPIWPTLGWGIGIAFHFAGAYVFPEANSVEKEYQKLKNKNKQ